MRCRAALMLAFCLSPLPLSAQADPTAAKELFGRGHLAIARKEYSVAIALWDQALRLDPDLWEAHYHCGEALLALHRPAEAVARFRQALQLQPDDARLKRALGRAEQEAQVAKEREPDVPLAPAPLPSTAPANTEKEQERRFRELVKSANIRVKEHTAGEAPIVLVGQPGSDNPTASAPAGPPPSASIMDQMRQQASSAFTTRLKAAERQGDALDNDFRRYLDACYRKYVQSDTNGVATGYGVGVSTGVAVGRGWVGAWRADSAYSWTENVSATTHSSNEDMPFCRALWSDIETRSERIKAELDAIDEQSRSMGIWPGIMREIRGEYRLWWE